MDNRAMIQTSLDYIEENLQAEITAAEQADLQRLYRKWSLKQPALDKTIAQLREEIRRHEEEIDELLMLRIQSTK